jgi:hypothetical protein
MPYKDKEKEKLYKKEWGIKNAVSIRERQTNYLRTKRTEAIKTLGGKCVYCGCDIQKALELNHKNGGGNKEKASKQYQKHGRTYQIKMYLDIINSKRNDIELTCRVCNSVHYLKRLGIGEFEVKWKNPNSK